MLDVVNHPFIVQLFGTFQDTRYQHNIDTHYPTYHFIICSSVVSDMCTLSWST
jgi:hypothetical protein